MDRETVKKAYTIMEHIEREKSLLNKLNNNYILLETGEFLIETKLDADEFEALKNIKTDKIHKLEKELEDL